MSQADFTAALVAALLLDQAEQAAREAADAEWHRTRPCPWCNGTRRRWCTTLGNVVGCDFCEENR